MMTWDEYEEKKTAMFASVEKYKKNFSSITAEDRRGKYKNALQRLFEQTFKAVRWYVMDQASLYNLFIVNNEAGIKCFNEMSKDIERIDANIADYIVDGNEEKLNSIIADLQENAIGKWFDYASNNRIGEVIPTPMQTNELLDQMVNRAVPKPNL